MSILGYICILQKNKTKQKTFHKFIALTKNLCSISISSRVCDFFPYLKSVI